MRFIYEHLLAKAYGWELEYIRKMDNYDFQAHLTICKVSELADRKWDILLKTGKNV